MLRAVGYDHPDAVALTAQAQLFYVEIYGGPDETPFTAAEFAPPAGEFLVGYLHGQPVAMGGWRFRAPGTPPTASRPAEIKRMYVHESVRGRGLARLLLAALETRAAAAGADWMVLETGRPQVAAVELYRSGGYADIPLFSYYADSPLVLNLGKRLLPNSWLESPASASASPPGTSAWPAPSGSPRSPWSAQRTGRSPRPA